MMPGFWYRLVSYIWEFPLEKRQSRYSGEVAVSFHRGQYKLSSRHAVYSFGTHYTSFSVPFQALGICSLDIPRVLVLGFGLGSVVNLLEKNKTIRQVTAVDSDAVILELAEKYLFSELKNKVQFVCADAATFLRENLNVYDLVLFDVFVDDKTPASLMEEACLLDLKRTLAPGGLLLYSKLDTTYADSIENAQFGKIFSRVFPAAFSIDADGNKIFCARN